MQSETNMRTAEIAGRPLRTPSDVKEKGRGA